MAFTGRAIVNSKWWVVNPDNEEIWKNTLREEGIPEEELEKEMQKLMANAEVNSKVRAVLITPEAEACLRRLMFVGGALLEEKEVTIIKEALWPK